MFTIALQPKSVASHLRFIQSRMVQDSFLPIPISVRGGTDMTHPSFVMIFRDDIHSGSDCGMSADDLGNAATIFVGSAGSRCDAKELTLASNLTRT
jgi:hypothetical protein